MLPDVGLGAKHVQFKKIYKTEKTLISLFFDPLSNPYYIKQNPVVPS